MNEISGNAVEQSTIPDNWCEKSAPELARFNKAFVRRNGKGFARVVVLKAFDEEDINFCFKKEKEYFEANGWSCVMSNETTERDIGIIIFRSVQKDDEICNTFVINGISKPETQKKLLSELIDQIGFIDLTMEFMEQVGENCLNILFSRVEESGIERFVNDIVMNHYKETDSDYMTEKDLVMMFGTANIPGECKLNRSKHFDKQQITTESDVIPKAKGFENRPTQSTPSINKMVHTPNTKAANKTSQSHPVSNTTIPQKKKQAEGATKQNPNRNTNNNPVPYEEEIHAHTISSSKHFLGKQPKFRPLPESSDIGVIAQDERKHTTPSEKYKESKDTELKSQNSVNDANTKNTISEGRPPESASAYDKNENTEPPAPVKAKKISFISKESLTDADKKQNDELLHNIRSKYEGTLQFIRDLHSPQFTVFINLLNEALNGNKYTKQLCPVYLDITDDLTTELYARLYELDQTTAEFNKTLIHQTTHLGCPFCANEWDEDITFMSLGLHYIRCPKCSSERPFLKE